MKTKNTKSENKAIVNTSDVLIAAIAFLLTAGMLTIFQNFSIISTDDDQQSKPTETVELRGNETVTK